MSMFREHYIGGIISYTSFFILSLVITLLVSFVSNLPIDWNPTIPMELKKIAFCFAIAVLSGLWPDVDIKSISQKIFYRIFVVVNIFLISQQMFIESALFGLFAMLPMLGKHRGWTHSRLTMFLLPGLLIALPLYIERESLDRSDWFSDGNLILVRQALPFYFASLIGYATHLQLDGILLRGRRKKRKEQRRSIFNLRS